MNLNGAAGLIRSTAGRTSACWAGKHRSSSITSSSAALRAMAQSSSFKVMVYDEPIRNSRTGSAIIARNT